MQRLADGTDLQCEPMPGQPVIELFGEHRVLIERHRGVTEYGADRICVRMCFGSLCVSGSGLELTRMSIDQLIISGRIDSVSIIRGK